MNKKLMLIVALVVAFVVVFTSAFSLAIPSPKTEEQLAELYDICKDYQVSDKLYVIDSATFKSTEERHLAVSLQGIVAKVEPQIFIITNEISYDYLDIISKSGVKLIFDDSKGEPWTVETLLDKFKPYITDYGYVLYRSSEKAEGLNAATNLAALYGWLPVPLELQPLAEECKLELKEDFSDDEYNLKFQKEFFQKYKSEFEYNAVVSLRYEWTGLRDLAIQQGFYTFYIDDDEDGDSLRGKILDYAGPGTTVLGWAKHEVPYVSQASKNGSMVIPTDHCHNNSFLASFKCDIPEQKHNKTKKYIDTSKHYVAIVFSDGDNVQWLQNGFNEYFEKLSSEEQFPMTWTVSPSLQEFSSVTASMIYSASTVNDYLIAGVSGAGYIHPTEYPLNALDDFTDITASSMLKSGLSYVSILDSTPNNLIEDKALEHRLEYYARYDNIKGGVLSLDPDKYQGGEGKVYFANGKPFVSNRLSLWHPDGEDALVTEEWLKEQADIVNSYPADMETINGYSVINVHPWSISVENLSYFVSQLDEDVQLVTLDELLTLVENNIPHETATPDK
ncbi:MAG: hypothetical protein J6K49_01840 [Clostridia bacterium]|nr:hypothetical protein [Clostridia bacterium]MBQ6837639.1 hypothetical protein [Clostridia bacterium]